MLALWHWHIEISSKCTLKCPRCARQEVSDGLKNTELDLAFFHRNFPPAFIEEHVRKVTFCGDDGDPIYAHDLIKVIRYFKSCADVEIVVVTNGSHKPQAWWRELGYALDHRDTVHFSIDGYDNASNNVYRVNSDWDSIMEGIIALRESSTVRLVWATIVFDFNQDHLDRIERHARSRGCDFLQITRSTKFAKVYPIYGPEDKLQPRAEWIAPGHRFDREVIPLDRKVWPAAHSDNIRAWTAAQEKYKNNSVLPLCAIGNKGLFINSQGHFFPCCWVANRYEHNAEWIARGSQFDLTQITLFEALKHSFWHDDLQTFRWQECQNKCKQEVVNDKYATEW